MKKTISILFALLYFLNVSYAGFGVFAESNGTAEQKAIIRRYWESVITQNCHDWVNTYAPDARESYQSFVDNSNPAESHIGIFSIKSVTLNSIVEIDKSYAVSFYKELSRYYEGGGVVCFRVGVSLETYSDNEFYKSGNSEYVFILVEDNGDWFVGAVYTYREPKRGIVYGLIGFITQPSTITVMDDLGIIHNNISFESAVINATCNEIGTLGYPQQAVYANVMAVKMLCWWAKAGYYRQAIGCHVKFGDVAYRNQLRTTTEQTAVISAAVANMRSYYMVSNSQTGGKLFYADYDGHPSQGLYCGTLSQPHSKTLANNGRNWQYILHYFYDYSSPNCSENIGKIQIGHECKHALCSSYSTNQTAHWHDCLVCGAKIGFSLHKWVNYGSYRRCSVCNHYDGNNSQSISIEAEK